MVVVVFYLSKEEKNLPEEIKRDSYLDMLSQWLMTQLSEDSDNFIGRHTGQSM